MSILGTTEYKQLRKEGHLYVAEFHVPIDLATTTTGKKMASRAYVCRREVVALCDLLVKLLDVGESGNDAGRAALGLLTVER